MERLMEWIVPKTPIYFLDRSGDILVDMVRALAGVRRALWREIGEEPPTPPWQFRGLDL